jgi:hypothetical protein
MAGMRAAPPPVCAVLGAQSKMTVRDRSPFFGAAPHSAHSSIKAQPREVSLRADLANVSARFSTFFAFQYFISSIYAVNFFRIYYVDKSGAGGRSRT